MMPAKPASAWLLAAYALATYALAAPALAVDYTLRAGDEPASRNKDWDQGASLSVNSVDGKSSLVGKAMLRATHESESRSWLRWLSAPDPDVEPADKLLLSAGPYLRRDTGAKPVNDRGLALSAQRVLNPIAHRLVWQPELNASFELGRTLKEAPDKSFMSVRSQRGVLSAGAFFDPPGRRDLFYGLTVGAWHDRARGAPLAALNGSEAGLLLRAQASWYLAGLFPPAQGGWRLIPVLELKAQKQFGLDATGNRKEQDYRLLSVTLSIPFEAVGSADRFVPSLDFQWSRGADLLAGRADSRRHSVMFALKY